ncbi:hypothetical protein ACHAQH_003109 [Verticillium albo-atrum]
MRATLVSAVLAYAVAGIHANGPGPWGDHDGDWDDDDDHNGRGWGWGWGRGGGWDGPGPKCASSCLSSHWQTATPTPSAFCSEATSLASCVSSACTNDADAYNSYNSRSSSACSRWATCSTTGTYTYSYDPNWWGWATPTVTAGSIVTVTGCPWNGGDWGWGIWGDNDGWGDWGPGWAYETDTVTVTVTGEGSASGDPTLSTFIVAQAVSGDETVRTTFTGAAAAETGNGGSGNAGVDGDSAAPGGDDLRGIKAIAACLAAVLVGVGLM